jgi:hypothetical protein
MHTEHLPRPHPTLYREHPLHRDPPHVDQDILQQFSESDPKQLKQVIEALIAKSRMLIQNL